MRREGFELMVGPPQVIEKEIDGERMEPFEMVDIELPEEFSGAAIALLNERKGNMTDMGEANASGMLTVQFELPTRGLVGVKSRLLSATRGLAVMSTTFAGYQPYAGDFGGRERGNLLSYDQGEANAHGLEKAEKRGKLFSKPGDPVYVNQIIGINSKTDNLKVNVCKTKQLTNIRSTSADDKTHLAVPMQLTLEEAVEYVIGDEVVEVTPDAIRMAYRAPPPVKGEKAK